MRKVFLSFLIFYSVSAQAQQSKFLLGINAAGVWNSYSFVKNVYPDAFKSRLNTSIGIQAKYFFKKNLYLDAQTNFSTKNFDCERDLRAIDFLAGVVKYTIKQNYIEVPITINYLFTTENVVDFFYSIGVTNSFSLSAKYESNNSNINSNSEVFEKYKSYLLSLKTGGGILFPLSHNFYGTVECSANIYFDKVYAHDPVIQSNPFQLALGFSVLKKLGSKKISTN